MSISRDSEAAQAAAAAGGDEAALASLFASHREKLRRMVETRLDQRVAQRVDAEDILQEAWFAAVERHVKIGQRGEATVFVWFRSVVEQVLIDVHRRHLGAQKRTARAEVPLRFADHGVSSESLAFAIAASLTSPSEAAMRAEIRESLLAVLDKMSAIDREVLILRHFEELSNNEVAEVLGLQKTAVSNRYVRALHRISEAMDSSSGSSV